MVAKHNPKLKIYPTQKQGMQAMKGGTKPEGEQQKMPEPKRVQSGDDRNRGETGVVID